VGILGPVPRDPARVLDGDRSRGLIVAIRTIDPAPLRNAVIERDGLPSHVWGSWFTRLVQRLSDTPTTYDIPAWQQLVTPGAGYLYYNGSSFTWASPLPTPYTDGVLLSDGGVLSWSDDVILSPGSEDGVLTQSGGVLSWGPAWPGYALTADYLPQYDGVTLIDSPIHTSSVLVSIDRNTAILGTLFVTDGARTASLSVSPTATQDTLYTLPGTLVDGGILTTDGAGSLSWAAPGSVPGTVSYYDRTIQGTAGSTVEALSIDMSSVPYVDTIVTINSLTGDWDSACQYRVLATPNCTAGAWQLVPSIGEANDTSSRNYALEMMVDDTACTLRARMLRTP
jgi:hypothetical protein